MTDVVAIAALDVGGRSVLVKVGGNDEFEVSDVEEGASIVAVGDGEEGDEDVVVTGTNVTGIVVVGGGVVGASVVGVRVVGGGVVGASVAGVAVVGGGVVGASVVGFGVVGGGVVGALVVAAEHA